MKFNQWLVENKKKSVEAKKEFVKSVMDKYGKKMPPIDKERYTELKGMEGPFRSKSGRVIYYDPKEGKYYDRDSDMYLDSMDENFSQEIAGIRQSAKNIGTRNFSQLNNLMNNLQLLGQTNPAKLKMIINMVEKALANEEGFEKMKNSSGLVSKLSSM